MARGEFLLRVVSFGKIAVTLCATLLRYARNFYEETHAHRDDGTQSQDH